MRGYRPEHFELHELVPPEIFHARGEAGWELLEPRLLVAADRLRDKFGTCIVNDWFGGGRYRESGLRDPVTGTGARLSQHKRGAALDCKFRDAEHRVIYDYLLEHADEFPEITVIEDIAFTRSWLHIDVRAASWQGIRVVRP